MMKNGWENFGDVNPIEHGGLFIKQDTDFPKMYHVVELHNMDWSAGEPGFYITEGAVDLDDDWIEWDSVYSSYGIEKGDDVDPTTLVIAAFGYYGHQDFQGTETMLETEEEAIESLKKYHRIFLED